MGKGGAGDNDSGVFFLSVFLSYELLKTWKYVEGQMLNCVDGFLVLPINKQHFSLDGDSPDMDSGNQISFSSLISFHMISFHMILTWSIRYYSVR